MGRVGSQPGAGCGSGGAWQTLQRRWRLPSWPCMGPGVRVRVSDRIANKSVVQGCRRSEGSLRYSRLCGRVKPGGGLPAAWQGTVRGLWRLPSPLRLVPPRPHRCDEPYSRVRVSSEASSSPRTIREGPPLEPRPPDPVRVVAGLPGRTGSTPAGGRAERREAALGRVAYQASPAGPWAQGARPE